MFLSTPVKFFLVPAVVFCALAACTWPGPASNAVETAPADASELPFSAVEPEAYQAEIVITANGSSRRTFVARSGEKRRVDYSLGSPQQVSILETDRRYLVLFGQKLFASFDQNADDGTSGDPPDQELTSFRKYSDFEKIGTEGEIDRYVAKPAGGGPTEALIDIDTKLGLPLRQQLFSLQGDMRTLEYSVELRNVSGEPDPGIFEIPAGFRETSIDNIRRIIARGS